ncbi:hypothetical protein LL037_00870 [Clostridium estertheticum]|uniref:7TM diverse intracellular signaling domain-containing protein n=1 Tax=Clostridium estertheticum TaxID=238834 RepID=UPI0024C979BF|nr:hypothetical protein LL037_00870 [Clostridium estertheticum]
MIILLILKLQKILIIFLAQIVSTHLNKLTVPNSSSNINSINGALNFLYFGVFLIVALYHLWLYIFRTEDISKLYLGCLCIIMSLRALIVGNKYFLFLYPTLNYTLVIKLQYLTIYLAVFFMLSFMFILFKESSSKTINNICKLFCLFFIATKIKLCQ